MSGPIANPALTPGPAGTGPELVIEGRIVTASNATFYGHLGETAVVYKPVAGERPLWDFPGAVLARREVAAYLVSEASGWNLVPRTWAHEGPLGIGMVQEWQEADADAVDLVPAGDIPARGWRHVFDGIDTDEQLVSVIHRDSPELRRMAVFDVVVNNADRKGGHILTTPDGHVYGVDHGLTFHVEPKLRTVLWGWTGEALADEERAGLNRILAGLDGSLSAALGELLDEREKTALRTRVAGLLDDGIFPAPSGPAVPWPPF